MSKLAPNDILKLFKVKIVEFLDALIEQFPNEGDFILLRVILAEQVPMDQVIQIFANRILPYKQMVISRNEKFFLECEDVFSGVGQDKVSYFKNIWTSGNLDDDDKDNIWQWFNLFLTLTENYKTAVSN